MAKILSIEAEASQIRVAEVEVRGKREGFIIVSVYRHPRGCGVMDRSVTRKLSERILRQSFPRERLRQRKYILPQVLPGLRAGKSVSLCEGKQNTEYYRGKCHRLFSH